MNVGQTEINCHCCDSGQRRYTAAPSNATLQRWPIALNTMAMASSALQLARLWRWLATHCSMDKQFLFSFFYLTVSKPFATRGHVFAREREKEKERKRKRKKEGEL
jgi:hypothetical protein